MGCDYYLMKAILFTTADGEKHRIDNGDIIDRIYCSSDSEREYYNSYYDNYPKLPSKIIFERTETGKKWYIDDIDTIQEYIELIKRDYNFDNIVEITIQPYYY
jgi:hypothetical protein